MEVEWKKHPQKEGSVGGSRQNRTIRLRHPDRRPRMTAITLFSSGFNTDTVPTTGKQKLPPQIPMSATEKLFDA